MIGLREEEEVLNVVEVNERRTLNSGGLDRSALIPCLIHSTRQSLSHYSASSAPQLPNSRISCTFTLLSNL